MATDDKPARRVISGDELRDRMLRKIGIGVALTSTAHPMGGDGSYIDYIDPSKLIEAEVEIDGDLIVPQAFIISGHRKIKCRELGSEDAVAAALIGATVDLMTTLKAWLAIQMPVYEWRQEPEIQVERDFVTDTHMVRFTARGRLDIPTRVADHRLWMIELP